MKIIFDIRCYPNETTMVTYCDANVMNVFLRVTTTNAILYTDSYILTFPSAHFLLLNCVLSIIINEYVTLCYSTCNRIYVAALSIPHVTTCYGSLYVSAQGYYCVILL